jgi:YebC/PmpR family DNA-binding regulatory protein
MAGHSKWNNIKNRKGAQDAKKGKAFSMAAKAIKMAVKEGKSGDPKSNPTLRLALDKARAVNMPKDKIQKAIDRGLGKTDSGSVIKEVVYEGYASGGVGLMVVTMTDNTNRTSSEVRTLLSKSGGSLGGPGSVAFMFTREDGEYKSTMPMQIPDEAQQESLQELMDNLRELDDVEDVYCSGEWEGKE